MSDCITFYFEDIFPDYDTFSEYVIENSQVINTANEEDVAFIGFCWNILSRHFHNQNIRYDSPQNFLASFMLVFDNKFQQFKKQKSLVDKIYNLTENEILQINNALSNVANNPNNEVADPSQPLNYISAQTFSLLNDNKLKGYLNALNTIPTLKVFNFLRGADDEMWFSDLFMNVQIPQKFLYNE